MTTARRVLLVHPSEGARWRSIAAYTGSVAAMLRDAGVEVVLSEAPWFNPPSLLAGALSRWWRQPAIRAAANGEFDVVHLTDQALAHHAPRFSGQAALVVSCHDLMPFTTRGYYSSAPEAVLKRTFLRRPLRALKRADGIVAVSQFTAGELAAAGLDPGHISIVPNVLRAPFSPLPAGEAELRLAQVGITLPPGPRVLSVGNDRAYKNLDALLEALAHPGLAHARLIRVGPLTKNHAAALRRLGLAHRTSFVGSVDDDALALLYAAADVLAQPSIGEGFGVPVIEAMACGLPVVVSDGGALPEVVGGAGIVVPLGGEGFPSRFADGLAEALRRGPELAEAGMKRSMAFASAVVAPRLMAAYEVAERNASRPARPEPAGS